MSSEERGFSGKVYSRRNRKDVSPATATDVTAPETKVSKVIAQTDHLVSNSISGYVPKGNVELRESSQCNHSLISRVEDRVRVRLNKSRSVVEIGEARRVFEGELVEVKGMVNKIEAKEKLQRHTSGKHRGLVLKNSRPISSYRYPRYMIDDMMKNRCPNLVRPIDVPNDPFRQPPSVANNGIIVEREKRNRKLNRFYNSSDYLLEKDKLPFEIYKRSKKNKKETKNKGFAAGLKQGTSGEMRISSHVEGVREADNGNSDSGSSSTENLCY